MAAIVDEIVEQLLARHPSPRSRVDLDDIAELEIDARPVTYEQVEDIILRLEAKGLRVGEPLTGRDVGVIRNVIVAGHRLTEKLRRRPTIDELAAECRLARHVVRRALELGRAAAPRTPKRSRPTAP